MDEQVWRLTWALPLVILMGLGLIVWLKRLGLGMGVPDQVTVPVVRSNTALTEHTRVLVVEVNAQSFVIFESAVSVAVQPAPPPVLGVSPRAFPWRFTRRST